MFENFYKLFKSDDAITGTWLPFDDVIRLISVSSAR